MGEVITAYRDRLEEQAIRWRTLARDYGSEYNDVYKAFTEVWKRDEENNKRKAEIFVLALSIVSSTVLMASFATSSLRVLVGRTALNIICSNNLNRTFNALYLIGNNKAAAFAIGTVMEAAETKLKKHLEAHAAKLLAPKIPVPAADPQSLQNDLVNYVERSHLYALNIASTIRDDKSLSENDRALMVKTLEKAPIFNPPINEIRGKLKSKIELSMHMSAILDSDFIQDAPARMYTSIGVMSAQNSNNSSFGLKTTPIQQIPSAPDYPRGTFPRPIPGGYSGHKLISINQPGEEALSRIDGLVNSSISREKIIQISKEIPLFSQKTWNPTQKSPAIALLQAENILNALADESRPLNFNTARV